MCANNKDLFFGLIRVKSATPYGYDGAEYELHFINNNDTAVIIKQKSKGGFKTYDSNTLVLATPHYEAADILVEPHTHVFYSDISEWDFDGTNQFQTIIETDGYIMILTFYLGSSAGFMGSLIPCLDKYGRVIHPQIKKIV